MSFFPVSRVPSRIAGAAQVTNTPVALLPDTPPWPSSRRGPGVELLCYNTSGTRAVQGPHLARFTGIRS